MNTLMKTMLSGLVLAVVATTVQAQEQSSSLADKAVTQNVEKAIAAAGIDPRITSVNVITTADHAVYLTGLISDPVKVKLAADAAAKAAPGYRIVNKINGSFFDDPNHVNGCAHCGSAH